MPSQSDEEAHQLSYLQKHMANILQLLAEPADGEGEESLVCLLLFSPLSLVEVILCFLYMIELNYLNRK